MSDTDVAVHVTEIAAKPIVSAGFLHVARLGPGQPIIFAMMHVCGADALLFCSVADKAIVSSFLAARTAVLACVWLGQQSH